MHVQLHLQVEVQGLGYSLGSKELPLDDLKKTVKNLILEVKKVGA
jgi:hypothetical protein